MSMKYPLLSSLAALSLVLVSIPTVHAETTAAHIAAIQARGNTDISARITSLNTLATNVAATKRLTSAEKTSLTAAIQAQTSALSSFNTKLTTDTDVDTAKTDFQDIFSEHYIYAFYLPTTERVVAADDEGQAASTLTSLVTTLQGYINTAQTKGNNVASLQASLNDMQAKAADATTESTAVITSLSALSASGYPGNKTTVTAAATTVKNTRTELATARTDAATIVAGLKKMLNATSTPAAASTTTPAAATAAQ